MIDDAGVERDAIGPSVTAVERKGPCILDNDARPNADTDTKETVMAGNRPGRARESGVAYHPTGERQVAGRANGVGRARCP